MARKKQPRSTKDDELARAVNIGFSHVTRELTKLDTKSDRRLDAIESALGLLSDNVIDIKKSLGPLTRSVLTIDQEVLSLRQRVSILEKKVGR